MRTVSGDEIFVYGNRVTIHRPVESQSARSTGDIHRAREKLKLDFGTVIPDTAFTEHNHRPGSVNVELRGAFLTESQVIQYLADLAELRKWRDLDAKSKTE